MKSAVSRRQFLHYLGLGSAAVVLAACQPAPTPAPKEEPTQVAATSAPEPTQAAPTAAAPANTPEAGQGPAAPELPIVKEPLTLTYWVTIDSVRATVCKSYNDVTVFKEIEKKTGIHMDFQHPASGQEEEQFNLMIASGKYPDVIEFGWLYVQGGPEKAVKDGVILRLNEVIDQHAPFLKKVLDEHPDWRKQVSTDEGDIYGFPNIMATPYQLTYSGPVIRKDWLDKLGLPVPTTLDEWHAMLQAFKDKDPNGNGQADEVAFSPSLWGTGRTGFDLGDAFVGAWGISMGYYQDKGVVKYGPLEPGFKEFLKLMAGWYKEGLIDPEYVSADGKLMDAKITGNQLGSFIQLMGSGMGRYLGLMKDKNPNFKLVGAPYPVLKKGDRPELGQKDNNFTGSVAAITTANKHVVETAKWMDYKYSPEGHMLVNFGIEGLTYRMVDGYPTYTDEILNNPQGLSISQAMSKNILPNHEGPFVQDPRYLEQYAALPEQKEALKTWSEPSNEKRMPLVTPTEDENTRFSSIMTDVNTLYDEKLDKVITGAELAENWDQVVAQFRQMGIEEAIKIQQAALDRYNKR